ncbi:MAG: hypothetical protein N2049_00810 [Anaerolineales bacterium]|nr:hypothetical protein [Anaerolineales bacterium]
MNPEPAPDFPSVWIRWGETLRYYNLHKFAVWLLEVLGPVNVLLAQFLHAFSPLLRPTVPESHLLTLLAVLEDPQETLAFTHFLKEMEKE